MFPALARLAALVAVATLSSAALGAPNASSLLFEAPALERVPTGTTLVYALERTVARSGADPAETPSRAARSSVELSLQSEPDAGGRQVKVEIVTGERRQAAGPFPAVVGNPVVLVLLERDVAEMSRTLRGSPFYLRNRVREALGETTIAEPVRFGFDGQEVEGWRVVVSPFAQDRNREKLREYTGKRYEFTLSDAVPGGIFEIRTVVPGTDGAPLIENRLSFERSESAGEAR
jgi:hypothetical protein